MRYIFDAICPAGREGIYIILHLACEAYRNRVNELISHSHSEYIALQKKREHFGYEPICSLFLFIGLRLILDRGDTGLRLCFSNGRHRPSALLLARGTQSVGSAPLSPYQLSELGRFFL